MWKGAEVALYTTDSRESWSAQVFNQYQIRWIIDFYRKRGKTQFFLFGNPQSSPPLSFTAIIGKGDTDQIKQRGKQGSVIDSDFSFLVISPFMFLLTKVNKNKKRIGLIIPTCSHSLEMLLRILLVFNLSRFKKESFIGLVSQQCSVRIPF